MSHLLGTAALMTVFLLGLAVATARALRSDILGLDRALAALYFHALHGETISLIVARWQAAGSRAGCRWCAFLSMAVERDHCAKQLDPNSPDTPIFNAARAGVCLFLLAVALWLIPLAIWLALSAVQRAAFG